MSGRWLFFFFYLIEIKQLILQEMDGRLNHIRHFCTLAPACQTGGEMIINREPNSVQ